MFCKNCGKFVESDADFYTNCGKEIENSEPEAAVYGESAQTAAVLEAVENDYLS